MSRTWWMKFALTSFAVLWSIYVLAPSVLEWLLPSENAGNTANDWMYEKDIKLGLDLQGGIHLVLGVDSDVALTNHLSKLAQDLKDKLKESGIYPQDLKVDEAKKHIEFAASGAEKGTIARQLIKDNFFAIMDFDDERASSLGSNFLVIKPKPEYAKQIKEGAVNQAIETIRNRVDEFGVAEPNIQIQGERRILVQLPGIKDPTRALNVIRRTALLEFKLVDTSMPSPVLQKKIDELTAAGNLPREHTGSALNEALRDFVPENREVAYEVKRDSTNEEVTKTAMLLESETLLTGSAIVDARVTQSSKGLGGFDVEMELDQAGASRFSQITGDNVGRQLAIVLDGNVTSAPRINERIPHGRAVITLGSSMDSEQLYNEASDLVVVLKAGSLPAPVTIEENRTVGPSLGKDSIEQGRLALIIGSFMVIVFMLLYYKSAGVVAVIALALNVLFILAVLTFFQATLTLPGIAGIILTIGMAVDGNVIINERIKEEMRAGRTLQSAIGTGYSRAQLTLLDANLTTFIAGIILFQYGTGPIQGFAVTLMIGVVTSFITSLSVTRFIFEFYLEKLKFKSLWI